MKNTTLAILIIIVTLLFDWAIVHGDIYKTSFGMWLTEDNGYIGSNISDTSGNGNTCFLVLGATGNTSTTTTVGKFSQAMVFDGVNDYEKCGDPTSTHATAFTVSVWFKRTGAGTVTTTGTGGVANFEPLVTKGAAEADGSNVDANYDLGIQTTPALVLAADFESTLSSNNNNPIVASTTLSNGKWYHAVYTFDGTNNCLYLNGKKDPKCNTSNETPRSDSIQKFGVATTITSTNTVAGFFNGAIDDVRMYSRALSAAEVQQLYMQGLYHNMGDF